MKKIKGQRICGIHTLKSRYDNNSVGVILDNGNSYRITCSELLKMVNEFTFDTETKRVYKYLINPIKQKT